MKILSKSFFKNNLSFVLENFFNHNTFLKKINVGCDRLKTNFQKDCFIDHL